MMRLLLIDAGNSRIKWATVKENIWSHHGVLDNREISALPVAFAELPPPDRIFISNVAGGDMAQRLRASCASWSCQIEFITAQPMQCGVRNGYTHPTQLGSDRWAALVWAWHQEHAPCLVVNCGTATTVDALSATGEFLGGLIIPGVDLMQGSLAAGTSQLPRATGIWREFPINTADAIFTGSVQATIGAIHLQQHALAAAGNVRCLLSGGAADTIQPHLRLPFSRVDNLVLRGLYLISQENNS